MPYFIAIFAAGNFLGPVLLGRYFDNVGPSPRRREPTGAIA
jgi:hypothetical protein